MYLRLLAIALLLPLGAIVSGCACPSSCRAPCTPSAPCVPGEDVAPGDPPDLVKLAVLEADLKPLPAPEETYQLLDVHTCQCHAATNANIANMVELERHWAKVVIECDTENVRENLCLDRDLLALHANDIRNATAASALEAFYQLAGLEAQQHYLLLATGEVKNTLERIDNFKEKGISLPDGIDRAAIVSQLNELHDRKLQLDFLRIQLNGQLQKLIGCPLNEYAFYWPQTDWEPNLEPLDVDVELADGLATRGDLRGLSLLLCQLEKTTLPVARGVLKFADSTIGTVEPVDGVIHALRCFRCNEAEVPIRCKQLAMFYNETEKLATAEIKSAVYKISLQQQRVAVAQDTVQELRGRLRQQTEVRDVDDVSVFEISQIRGQLYEAESKLIEQVVLLEVATVELRKAQGGLALECGFIPRLCNEGCCDGACQRCNTCKKSRCSRCK